MVKLSGSSTRKTIYGSAGDDTSDGWYGDYNVFILGSGNDFFKLSGSSNIVKGGSGHDTLHLRGGGNAISGMEAIEIYHTSFANRIYGSNMSIALNGDTSVYIGGNENRIGTRTAIPKRKRGVSNVIIEGNNNIYSYDRSFTKVDLRSGGLNFGIKVTGNNNKIIDRSGGSFLKFRETSSLDIIGAGNEIGANQAYINLTNVTGSDTTVRGDSLIVNYNFQYYQAGDGLRLDGKDIDLRLNNLGEPENFPNIYLVGTVNVEKSLTINLDQPGDRFSLFLHKTRNNRQLHKISVVSFERLDIVKEPYLLDHYISFMRGDTRIGTIEFIKGNDDIYFNGTLIHDGK